MTYQLYRDVAPTQRGAEGSDTAEWEPAESAPAESDTALVGAASVDEVMAGFIVWLARQDVPAGRRSRYRSYADRYLRWRNERPGADVQQYYAELRGHGPAESETRMVGASIELLRRYLIASTATRAS